MKITRAFIVMTPASWAINNTHARALTKGTRVTGVVYGIGTGWEARAECRARAGHRMRRTGERVRLSCRVSGARACPQPT
eukprot:scaffold3720_cov401-Prasinococcus_capsulatus_cf.AAC.10